MDKCAQQTDAVLTRLVKQFGDKSVNKNLQDLFKAVTTDNKRDVRLQDLEDAVRSKTAVLRRGLAARSLAEQMERWGQCMERRRAKKM